MVFAGYNWTDLLLKVLAVVVILIVTAILAGLVKKGLRALLSKVGVLNRHPESGRTLADSLATIASMLVWLVGLMAVLNLFSLTGVLSPINGLLDGFLRALPNIIGAALILFVGLTLAKVVRELVTTALEAAGADRWPERLARGTVVDRELQRDGVRTDAPVTAQAAAQPYAHTAPQGAHTGQASYEQRQQAAPAVAASRTVKISSAVGQVVYALIAIVVSIAALDLLNIPSISGPASQMLRMILDAVPLVIAAGILLAIGVVVARFAGGLLETLLRGLGIERALARMGVDTGATDVVSIISRIVQVAIVLFFAIAATQALGFPALTNMLNTILDIGGHVVFGAVVIAAGIFIAQLVSGFLSGNAATIVRWATILLFVAIGLKFMGLADSIVNLAFGALVVGAAAAAALAFGLGGREAAARKLQKIERDGLQMPEVRSPALATTGASAGMYGAGHGSATTTTTSSTGYAAAQPQGGYGSASQGSYDSASQGSYGTASQGSYDSASQSHQGTGTSSTETPLTDAQQEAGYIPPAEGGYDNPDRLP